MASVHKRRLVDEQRRVLQLHGRDGEPGGRAPRNHGGDEHRSRERRPARTAVAPDGLEVPAGRGQHEGHA